MSFIADINNHVSSFTSVQAYPFTIPQGVEYPAIEFSPMSRTRNDDSNLNASNIINRKIQFTVVTKLSKTTIDMGESLITLYDGFSGLIGSTYIMISRINSSVPLYNEQQQTYEYAIDVVFTIKQ